MENHLIFNGEIHYFNGPCSIAMLVHQRVLKSSNDSWRTWVETGTRRIFSRSCGRVELFNKYWMIYTGFLGLESQKKRPPGIFSMVWAPQVLPHDPIFGSFRRASGLEVHFWCHGTKPESFRGPRKSCRSQHLCQVGRCWVVICKPPQHI